MATKKAKSVKETAPANDSEKAGVSAEKVKTPAKKAAPSVKKKVATKKPTTVKTAAKKKTAVKKTAAKKVATTKATKKVATKRTPAKTASVKKASAKKAAVKKTVTATKKTAAKTVAETADLRNRIKAGIPANNKAMEKMMSQGKSQMDQFAKQATDMNRETVEAFIKSTGIFTKGCEDMMRVAMSLVQDVSDKNSRLVQEAMGVKTLNEWTEVQNKILHSGFEELMSGATKLSEMSVKTLTDAVEPINSQVTKSVQKASDLMAA